MQGQPGLPMSWPIVVETASGAGVSDLVMSHAPMAVAVVDAEGVYCSVNPAHCALYGYSADELEKLAGIRRDKHRQLGLRRKQQLFFQQE